MNSMANVIVTTDSNGNFIGVSKNNPEYGYVRVEQSVVTINDKGWLRLSKRSALIKGKVEDLKNSGIQANSVLPGKIIIKESHEPFNVENPDRDLKIAGVSGVICRVGDMPIYRQSFYTENLTEGDVLIMHSNTDEIKEILNTHKEIKNVMDDANTF
jgi:hypothetical protein